MKNIILFFIATLGFGFKTGEEVFSRLYALEGTWMMKTRNGFIGEKWKKVDPFYLQSRGFFIKDKDTVINEQVALRKKLNDIYYTSTVSNQNNQQPIDFKLTSSDHNTYVFENPTHDFPKRIVYNLVGKDSLHAWIDDGTDGSKKREDFYYKRVQ